MTIADITAADLTSSAISTLRDQAAADRNAMLESACDYALNMLSCGTKVTDLEWAANRKVAMIVHAINTTRAA